METLCLALTNVSIMVHLRYEQRMMTANPSWMWFFIKLNQAMNLYVIG
jgi:hypothetical protein